MGSDADEAVRAIRARALARATRGEPASTVSVPGQRAAPAAPDPRDKVLNAATELLVRSSFAKVNLDDVALHAGVSRGELLKLCFSREELFFQVLTREVEQVTGELRGLLSDEVPAMELMRALSERGFAFVTSHPLLLQLLMGEAADAMPEWADRLAELRQRMLGLPMKVVQIGMDQEILRNDLPAELVATLLFEIHVAGYLLHHRPGPDMKLKAAQRRAAVLEVLYNGLKRRDR